VIFRRPVRFVLILVLTAIVLAASGPLWLPGLGKALIRDEGPAKADMAVVLAGDKYGRRIAKAAELIREGYVPKALVSGPPLYGISESDLAIAMMVRQGCPADWFISFADDARSTEDEANLIVPDLQRRGVRSFILVTSTYHTARAARVFRKVARRTGGPALRVVAAPDELFRPEDWWRNRDGQKIVVTEWMKVAATVFGI